MTQIAYYPLTGGEDLITPPLSVNPSLLRYSRNYECDRDGRPRRIDGYERIDGHPRPSQASYAVLNFDNGSIPINVGEIIENGPLGASGEVLEVHITSGSWGASDAAGFLILFDTVEAFQDNSDIQVSSVTRAVANGASAPWGAETDTEHYTWLHAAIEASRARIGPPPGSGGVLGAWQYNGYYYAFRNNATATAAKMYKSSHSGWVECDLGRTVNFTSGGTFEIQENNIIEGDISSATATVKRVIVKTGSWSGGDAAGTIVLYGQTGTFQAETLNVGVNSNVATIDSNTVETTLTAYGRYQFANHNFGGHSGTLRMYGCNGKNRAFEWDGSVYVPISTGMYIDQPNHIIPHENHLFLAFKGGSLQHSSIGDPYLWSPIAGAAEIGMGDEITAFLSMPKSLVVWTRNKIGVLYGTSNADWDLRILADESGAIEWTAQKIGAGIYLDDRGITALEAVEQYGDFGYNAISSLVQPFLSSMKPYVTCALRVRKKNQYRLFFSDGQALFMTLDKSSVVGFTRVKYDHPVSCCCSIEDQDGNEELLFGSTDGFVYQMDAGTSFDGGSVESYLKTHFNHFGTPSNKKRFRKLGVELDAPNTTTLKVQPDFSYGSAAPSQGQDIEIGAAGGFWEVDHWDSFVWDGPTVSTGEARIDGSGLSMSLSFYHNSIYDKPHTIQGLIVHYDVRGIQR